MDDSPKKTWENDLSKILVAIEHGHGSHGPFADDLGL